MEWFSVYAAYWNCLGSFRKYLCARDPDSVWGVARSLIFLNLSKWFQWVAMFENCVWKLHLKARNRILSLSLLGRLLERDSGLCRVNRPGMLPAFQKLFLSRAFRHSLLLTSGSLRWAPIHHTTAGWRCTKSLPAAQDAPVAGPKVQIWPEVIESLVCFGFNSKLLSLIQYFQGPCSGGGVTRPP